MPETTPVQILSVLFFALTGVLLAYASFGAPSLRKRLAVLAAILTVGVAISFMMKAYAGEKRVELERTGPIERRSVVRERGRFEFVDRRSIRDAAGNSSGSGAGDPAGAGAEHGDGEVTAMVRMAAAFNRALGVKPPLREIQDCEHCPQMVLVEPGYFKMGAPQMDVEAGRWERPQSVKRIGRAFFFARYETTVRQYAAFARATGRGVARCAASPAPAIDSAESDAPVTCVSIEDALAHAAWLSEITGKRYRLPSEAEWEYAARAGVETRYATGDRLQGGLAAIGRDGARPGPVGQYGANGLGLFDVHGNAAEIAADCWRESPAALPGDGRASMRGACGVRALRDAAAGEAATMARLTARRPFAAGARSPGVGYRLVRER